MTIVEFSWQLKVIVVIIILFFVYLVYRAFIKKNKENS